MKVYEYTPNERLMWEEGKNETVFTFKTREKTESIMKEDIERIIRQNSGLVLSVPSADETTHTIRLKVLFNHYEEAYLILEDEYNWQGNVETERRIYKVES